MRNRLCVRVEENGLSVRRAVQEELPLVYNVFYWTSFCMYISLPEVSQVLVLSERQVIRRSNHQEKNSIERTFVWLRFPRSM